MSDTSGDGSLSWVQWFCDNFPVFCEVDESYIEDTFNLYGIRESVPHYKEGMSLVRDFAADSDPEPDAWNGEYFEAAKNVYGLIHARFIITEKGMQLMAKIYEENLFGCCPRTLCDMHPLLPVGLYDELGKDKVKVYCASCKDIYRPANSIIAELDGAYFGTTFAHMLLLCKPHLARVPPVRRYVPRIFGFRIHAPLTPEEEHRSREATKARLRGECRGRGPFLVDGLDGVGPSEQNGASVATRKRRKDFE